MHLDVSRSGGALEVVERTVLDLVGRAMGRFAMLRPGDRVAVGVSGGKDSLCACFTRSSRIVAARRFRTTSWR
jgi:hypothetical protein